MTCRIFWKSSSRASFSTTPSKKNYVSVDLFFNHNFDRNILLFGILLFALCWAGVMAKWLAWQTAVLSGASSSHTHECRFSVRCKVIAPHYNITLDSVRCKVIAPHSFLWWHYWTDWVHHLYRQFSKNG